MGDGVGVGVGVVVGGGGGGKSLTSRIEAHTGQIWKYRPLKFFLIGLHSTKHLFPYIRSLASFVGRPHSCIKNTGSFTCSSFATQAFAQQCPTVIYTYKVGPY